MKPVRRGQSSERSPRAQRGFLLLQVSFLILVIMGLLAVVVDMGIARATQNMMQSSADIAALEALRFRDANLDPTLGDLERRLAAQRLAAYVFDEDLDLSTGPVAYRLGAGPQFTTGVGGVDDPAGGLLESQGPFLPALELNVAANESFGDLVAGDYSAIDPLLPGNPDWHAENGAYDRNDFAPTSAADAPTANAFLARIRRTNNLLNLDQQPGVSSAGPTLPYLFGLGSGVLSTDDPSVYDPRRDGITVRATAIADARPVVRAGVMSDTLAASGLNGIARVGIDAVDPTVALVFSFDITAAGDAPWQLLAEGSFCVEIAEGGAIFLLGSCETCQASGTVLGFVRRAEDLDSIPPQPVSLLRVGDEAGAVPDSVPLGPDIGPLLYAVLLTDGRISGFAAVGIDPPPLLCTNARALMLTKLPRRIAPSNASAVPDSMTDITALSPSASLLAPVLAR